MPDVILSELEPLKHDLAGGYGIHIQLDFIRQGAVREPPLLYGLFSLFDFRKKFRISNQLSHAVSVIFLKDIILAPGMQAVDIDLGALRPNAPGNL